MKLGIDELLAKERLSKELLYALLRAGVCGSHDGGWTRVSCLQHGYLVGPGPSLVCGPTGVKGSTPWGVQTNNCLSVTRFTACPSSLKLRNAHLLKSPTLERINILCLLPVECKKGPEGMQGIFVLLGMWSWPGESVKTG